MTLEARVRTVEAIERTECIEARASRCVVGSSPLFSIVASSGHSSSSYACLLFLMQNRYTRYVIKQTTAMPPMTPPAIAPAFGPELPLPDEAPDEGWAPIFVHCATAQVLQLSPISEQTSSEAQDGHGGGVAGQLAHLRKSVGVLKSTSTCTDQYKYQAYH